MELIVKNNMVVAVSMLGEKELFQVGAGIDHDYVTLEMYGSELLALSKAQAKIDKFLGEVSQVFAPKVKEKKQRQPRKKKEEEILEAPIEVPFEEPIGEILEAPIEEEGW